MDGLIKRILKIGLIFIGVVSLVGLVIVFRSNSNYKYIDNVHEFNYANITLQTGEVISGPVDNWRDYEGDQLQITMNGIVYLVHSSNVDLIKVVD